MSEDQERDQSALSRRALVRRAASGAAVVWAAPAILSVKVAAAQTSADGGGDGGPTPPACTSFTAVPYNAPGWRYSFTTALGQPGFEAQGYDDSSWAVGSMDFGSGGSCGENSTPGNTVWPDTAGSRDLLLRRSICLGPTTSGVIVRGTVDDYYDIYWNGTLVIKQGDGNCPTLDEHVAPVNDGLLLPSAVNVLAIRAGNTGSGQGAYGSSGGPAYINVTVTATNP